VLTRFEISGVAQMLQRIDPEVLAQHGVEIMFETKLDVSERTKVKKPSKGPKKTKKAEEAFYGIMKIHIIILFI
jgi:hypothetical protein